MISKFSLMYDRNLARTCNFGKPWLVSLQGGSTNTDHFPRTLPWWLQYITGTRSPHAPVNDSLYLNRSLFLVASIQLNRPSFHPWTCSRKNRTQHKSNDRRLVLYSFTKQNTTQIQRRKVCFCTHSQHRIQQKSNDGRFVLYSFTKHKTTQPKPRRTTSRGHGLYYLHGARVID